jgi:DNA (cytosine-5)-methyltransferase 1
MCGVDVKYLSVCSGIEAATVAWHPLGWKAFGFSEIEPFPCKVLAHHYPEVPNFGDMTKFKEWPDATINVLVGGTPCQSFSVAGLRKGLDDPRGNLMLTYLAIAAKYRPKWILWENVPGVLSSNGGRDFATFLRGLAECGYGYAYRVLDAQYVRTDGHPYAVPQRRRRVFVVGCIGDWRSAAAVLFDRESMSGNPAPSRKAGERVAPTLTVGPPFSCTGNQRVECDAIVAAHRMVAFGEYVDDGTASAMKARDYKDTTDIVSYGIPGNWIGRSPENGGNAVEPMHDVAPCQTKTDVHAVAYSFDSLSSNSMKSSNPESGCNEVEVCKTLDTSRGLDPSCNQGGIAVAFKIRGGCEGGGKGYLGSEESAFTLSTNQDQHLFIPYGVGEKPDVAHCLRSGASKADKHESTTYIAQSAAHTFKETADCLTSSYATKWNGNASADNGSLFASQNMQVRRLTPLECHRLQGFPDHYLHQVPGATDSSMYKALGNSMAVNVMQLIGQRIQMVETIMQERVAA